MAGEEQAPVAFFKRGKKGLANQRKRIRLSDDEDDQPNKVTDAATVARKLREKTSGAFTSTTANKKRKEEADNSGADERSVLDVAYAASGTAASLSADMATRTLDVDGREDVAPAKVLAGDEAESADNIYRGLSAYKEYVNKRTDSVTQSNASRIRAGPLRGSTNVRISCRFDYQPDICKDYKETGFCGYGDSCKFMHDRGDYKSGWQLDKEWDEKQKQENDPNRFLITSDDEKAEDEDEDEDLPFACVICRNDFKEPVVTKCKHYFCESCALKHHAKSPKCFICGSATQGLFAPAKELKAKLQEKKRRMAEREAEIRAQHQEDMEDENESD
ncbi:hypothetical protein SpCBS45565_g06754 [Spizellomyces sp. 'palustris']|nr:hypothetical protein SpCBS45565_g06754 [Spizellomyces sp. 'palustris']